MATYIKTPAGSFCARVRRTGAVPQSKTFASLALAKRWAQRLEGDAQANRAGVIPPKLTVAELVDAYSKEMTRTRPFGKNKASVLGYFKQILGRVRVAELDTGRVVKYINEERRVHGVTAAIDLSYLGSLLKASRMLWGYPIPSSIVSDARDLLKHSGMVTRSQERDRRPTTTEIEELRGWMALHSKSLRPDHIDFILDSCFRPPGELERLRWDDLNVADKTILIRDRKHPRKKYGNHQTVPLLGRSFEIVMRQPRTEEFIFPVNGRSWSSIFPRACRELEIVDLTLYDLRHEAISRLVETNKYSIPEMMLVTGHTDPKMLMRYTQLKAKDLHR